MKLSLYHPASDSVRFDLDPQGSPYSVGRGPENDVRLLNSTVSRNHAEIQFRFGQWEVYDLESLNGTTVNGVQVLAGTPHLLHDGDLVGFGLLHLRVMEHIPMVMA